ncbi:hypothetical protein [Corynebacterium uterequi]|uniref:Uncharacterized protein n=1 Tax=Corynebacterium uterequi TaxID=1072256 RepID=A0A0G3HAH3_9CORY|nr:hypothetical protein [Corynebacterium uterequi]AKK10329.1 hypothetical protein CUTER_01565 [Corynebacterium uterequi]
MKDPTRIPGIMADLTSLWEAQPDLTLAQVWGQLESRGLSAASTDEDVRALLAQARADYPVNTGAVPTRPLHLRTVEPQRQVTLTPTAAGQVRVTVRDPRTAVLPATWLAASVVRGRVSGPLVIDGGEGTHHRLGIITGIRALPAVDVPHGAWITPERFGHVLVGVEVKAQDSHDSELVLIRRREATVYHSHRRETDVSTHRWHRLAALRLGEPLVLELAGGRRLTLDGYVADYFLVDA